MMHVTVIECGQTQTKTNGEWANHARSMLLMWHLYEFEASYTFSPAAQKEVAYNKSPSAAHQ